MRLAEMVGIDRQELLNIVESTWADLLEPVHPAMEINAKSTRATQAAEAAESAYLLEDDDQVVRYGNLVISHLSDFFGGDWRTTVETDLGTVDPLWWKRHKAWSERLMRVIMWALVLNDDEAVKALAAYPDEHCMREDTLQQCQLVEIMCGCILGKEQKVEDAAVELAKYRRRSVRLPAEGLLALIQSDADALSRAIIEYNKMYRKAGEFPISHYRISYWGTILEMLGRRKGLDIQVPDPESLHNVKLKSRS